MAAIDMPHARPAPALGKPLELVCFALVVAHAVYLAASYWQGMWMVAPDGSGNPSDFVNVWAAGRLALDGHPAAAYDWPTHKAMEAVAVGHDFDGYFGWHYPLPFLFAAAALALMPYAAAYALWVAVTFPLYAAAVRGIVGERSGYLLAAAFPAVLSNFVVGQNGFLTAGLMGGSLLSMQTRPILSGVLLGLLTYKPHLGLLFPFVLAAAGYWRVFITAGVTAAAMNAISWLTFGTVTFEAFLLSIPHTSQAFLSDGWANFGKLQTIFGLARMLGLGETPAWALHGIVALTVAMAVCAVWRKSVAFEIKAAALATGAMIATPYLYTYDLVVLAIPLAFLYRLARRTGFAAIEVIGIALACALIIAFPFVTAPVGLAAVIIVTALVARRAFTPAAGVRAA